MMSVLLLVCSFAGCTNFMTRTESDVYTISEKDTTFFTEQKNYPGNRDNGVVYPSSRALKSERNMVQRDSVVERHYPDFIRLGVFESAGFIGPGKDNGASRGLFGVFPDFENLKSTSRGNSSGIFSGGLLRVGIGEWRLRWFRDAANWTFGTSMFEVISPDARVEKNLGSIFPLYIRKRYFITDQIPYITFTPSFGIGYFPSQYINLSGSLDVGSIGGFNIRAYLGVAAGVNTKSSYFVRASENNTEGQNIIYPYVGLGMSILDFVNIVPETLTEWKDHQNSSWNIGLIQAAVLATSSDSSGISEGTKGAFLNGALLRLCNTSVALPFLNNQFYFGTSLMNMMVLGRKEWGIGILPLRLGYWQTVLADELSIEPFIEYNYYPSNFFHAGARLNLRVATLLNIGIVAGYASGSSNKAFGNDLTNALGAAQSFSRPYVGISLGFFDRIFFPEEIRYNK